MKVINWPMLKNPLNWAIVLLMLLIAAFAGHYALALVGIHPNSGQ
jgi:hypothetical protein